VQAGLAQTRQLAGKERQAGQKGTTKQEGRQQRKQQGPHRHNEEIKNQKDDEARQQEHKTSTNPRAPKGNTCEEPQDKEEGGQPSN